MNPFLVCTLSRSRTKWLSILLTFEECICYCEVAIGMREVADIGRFFRRPNAGSAETAVAPAWPVILHHVPNIRAVVVRRPVEEAVASMCAALDGVVRYDLGVLRRNIRHVSRSLDRMSRSPGVLTVDFADLAHEDVCADVFRHCLGRSMPHDHWLALKDRNIQVNVKSMFDYYERNKEGVEGFKRACKAELWAIARAGAVTCSMAA